MVIQVFVGDQNQKGCPSRSEAQSDSAAKSTRACGGPGEGNRRPHWAGGISSAAGHAHLDIPQVGPHWTTTHSSEVTSAADACSTLRSAGESLRSSGQERGEGGTLFFLVSNVITGTIYWLSIQKGICVGMVVRY